MVKKFNFLSLISNLENVFQVEFMEQADAVNGVGNGERGKALEKIAHSYVARCPDGLRRVGGQFLAEKESGTLAGEHHSHVSHVRSVFPEHVLGYDR